MKPLKNYIASGTEITGKMTVQDPVTVNGTIVGSIEGHDEVIFDTNGHMEGPVHAPIITIKGNIKGDLHSGGKLEVHPGGHIKGKISTPKGGLIVKKGGVMESQVTISSQ